MDNPSLILSRMAMDAWAAGLIDGKGMFRFGMGEKARHSRVVGVVRHARPRIEIILRERDDTTITTLIDTYGGNRGYARTRYGWRMQGAKGCVALLERVMPYMVTQAYVARPFLAFCRHITDSRRSSFDDRELSVEQMMERYELLRAVPMR